MKNYYTSERKLASLRRELEKRATKIRQLEDTIEKFKDMLEMRPARCSKCGCEKIYKNGHYAVSLTRFVSYLKLNGDEQVKIQQFLCPGCGNTMHQSAKTILLRLFRFLSLVTNTSTVKIIANGRGGD